MPVLVSLFHHQYNTVATLDRKKRSFIIASYIGASRPQLGNRHGLYTVFTKDATILDLTRTGLGQQSYWMKSVNRPTIDPLSL